MPPGLLWGMRGVMSTISCGTHWRCGGTRSGFAGTACHCWIRLKKSSKVSRRRAPCSALDCFQLPWQMSAILLPFVCVCATSATLVTKVSSGSMADVSRRKMPRHSCMQTFCSRKNCNWKDLETPEHQSDSSCSSAGWLLIQSSACTLLGTAIRARSPGEACQQQLAASDSTACLPTQ